MEKNLLTSAGAESYSMTPRSLLYIILTTENNGEPIELMEVFGGCNYTCQMCPQSNPGRGKNFTRKMPLKEFEKFWTN